MILQSPVAEFVLQFLNSGKNFSAGIWLLCRKGVCDFHLWCALFEIIERNCKIIISSMLSLFCRTTGANQLYHLPTPEYLRAKEFHLVHRHWCRAHRDHVGCLSQQQLTLFCRTLINNRLFLLSAVTGNADLWTLMSVASQSLCTKRSVHLDVRHLLGPAASPCVSIV